MPCERLIDGANLTGRQQPVDVEVTSMIPGQGLGKYHARNFGRPQPTAQELLQTGALDGHGAQTAGVENQAHADFAARWDVARSISPKAASAHCCAARSSSAETGPTSSAS